MKYAAASRAISADDDGLGEALQTVEQPPAVQMFVPGFSVRQLPVELSNINNVKYRADGTLVALAYDGKVWLLRDSDGDGLEDRASKFWGNESGMRSPIGMDLTPPGYDRGDGLFVVGKTRCVLIVDTNGDDRGDKEVEVAGGWPESFHQVDGLGVAYDERDGSIYYGRGTYNFTDPLLRDKDGRPQYKLSDESGAIIRVSPDFKSREIVATGIRFPVAIRLNRHGDLFATDQEGATWVPNGNPFDELLHIQRGRHYGFPARHPAHLPNVIDEPSTFDYAPQHQSVCGLNFNEPVRPGGPIFGPAAWAGDAIVAGYSRGKLYRTQLATTASGYVARTQLLACLNMLTVDACIGPAGELVVACHSGGPDWGSGPAGRGKLFKIEFADRDHPQPVIAWASGPRELRVEFDRPVDPSALRNVLKESKLTAGQFVRAGDRFESLWPGYAAVNAQKLSPRTDIVLRSAQLTSDGRSLVVATDPMLRAEHYALQLPSIGGGGEAPTKYGALRQHDAIDLDFDLSGCEATWKPAGGGPTWTGWLPHIDLDVSRQFTAGSAPHDALWADMGRTGELVLRGQLDLTDMLRPAIQPGSEIDYEYPPEVVTATFAVLPESARLQLVGPAGISARSQTQNDSSVSFTLPSNAPKVVPVEIRLTTSGAKPQLTVNWTTNEDDRPRPFPLRRMIMPWARVGETKTDNEPPPVPPELAGGDWARGEREFFGDKAACGKCHTANGRGGTIGPDLTNLVHRDYASVLRDIMQPSYAINPDYLSYTVVLTDGRVLTGVVQTAGNEILIGDTKGQLTKLKSSEVEEMLPASASIMPEGIVSQLGPDRLRDLLTFLLTRPPKSQSKEAAIRFGNSAQ
jgi:putative heme-binding domain-containing protein